MNFFSSPEFLTVVAQVFYPGRAYDIGLASVGPKCFQTLILKGPSQAVARVPFLDFFEEIAETNPGGATAVKGLVPLSTGVVTSSSWLEQRASDSETPGAHQQIVPAPHVQWRIFPTFESFRAHVRARSPFPFNVSKRKIRKLEREFGGVTFAFHDPDAAVLERCLAWKSEQYRRTGLWDLFASERNRALFHELNRRGLLTTTALRAGDSLLGVHLGVLHQGRFYSWLPSYDPDFHKFSPGTLLFDYLLEQSYQRKHEIFDFLIGDEAYKWNYATHAHKVLECGTPSLSQRVYEPLREAVVARLRGDNRIYKTLQALKRRALEYRLRRGKSI